jgi:hypothetical protein
MRLDLQANRRFSAAQRSRRLLDRCERAAGFPLATCPKRAILAAKHRKSGVKLGLLLCSGSIARLHLSGRGGMKFGKRIGGAAALGVAVLTCSALSIPSAQAGYIVTLTQLGPKRRRHRNRNNQHRRPKFWG